MPLMSRTRCSAAATRDWESSSRRTFLLTRAARSAVSSSFCTRESPSAIAASMLLVPEEAGGAPEAAAAAGTREEEVRAEEGEEDDDEEEEVVEKEAGRRRARSSVTRASSSVSPEPGPPRECRARFAAMDASTCVWWERHDASAARRAVLSIWVGGARGLCVAVCGVVTNSWSWSRRAFVWCRWVPSRGAVTRGGSRGTDGAA